MSAVMIPETSPGLMLMAPVPLSFLMWLIPINFYELFELKLVMEIKFQLTNVPVAKAESEPRI